MRILIVEDDRELAAYVRRALEEAGHVADVASNGIDALGLVDVVEFDVLVVDRMMPRMDGMAFITQYRSQGGRSPILVLSALAEVDNKVEGLRAGADDYLAKPFATDELLARLDVLGRRRDGSPQQTRLQVADLEMDLLARTVTRQGQDIELQPREFRLLEFLMRHANQVVTRTMLLEKVWDIHYDPTTNVIDVHISRLRSKIDRDFAVPLLHTVRGAGYRLGT